MLTLGRTLCSDSLHHCGARRRLGDLIAKMSFIGL